jgi:hypothetical protein
MREPSPRSPKRQKVRDRISREAWNGKPGIVAPPRVVPKERVEIVFGLLDKVRARGVRGVVVSVRPGEVVVRGVAGWIPVAEVEADDESWDD